jgi:hypothetical protein
MTTMNKILVLTVLILCAWGTPAMAEDVPSTPHVFDDLNNDGVSDGAARATDSEDNGRPSTETVDNNQPVDEVPPADGATS